MFSGTRSKMPSGRGGRRGLCAADGRRESREDVDAGQRRAGRRRRAACRAGSRFAFACGARAGRCGVAKSEGEQT